MMRPTSSQFSLQEFKNPPIQHASIYSWVWNGVCSREKTEEQLLEMQRLGIRAFYIIPEPKMFRPFSMPTELEPDYLTKPYFEEYAYAIQRGKELGMECWFYDEGGWPSGGACGKVLMQYPELARRVLKGREVRFESGSRYVKSDGDVVAAFDAANRQIQEGFYFPVDTTVTEYYSSREFFKGHFQDYPDLTMRESSQRFIEMTHEEYKPYLQEYFGKEMKAVFTDEPKAPTPTPFRRELVDEYEEKYGESIIPALPALFGRVKPVGRIAEMVANWYDLCSRHFCDDFLMPNKKWANENNMLFTGHMDKDDEASGWKHSGNFHLMRALRCLDIPGIDVIWRQIFPGKPYVMESGEVCAANKFFPRCASSAAAQVGSDYAMTESLGVYGNGVTYDQMRFCMGFQAIRGINIYNQMLIMYARKGHMIPGELPSFEEKQAFHEDLGVFNEYLERLSYVSSVGERICDTALYYPMRDIWAETDAAEKYETMGRQLEECQVDFDILDDDVLEGAAGIEEGRICMGKACYRKVYIPANQYMSEKTKMVLARFAAAGGQVLTKVELKTGPEGLRVMRRKTDQGELTMYFNENEVALTMEARGYIVNITEGKLYKGNTVTLECGETVAFYDTDEELPADELFAGQAEVRLPDTYDFHRVKSFEIGYMYSESHELTEQSVSIALGDWAEVTGKEFSGSGVYETKFTKPENVQGKMMLDLGVVKYTCEVILNGRNLGKKVMAPYQYAIDADLLQDENQLSIKVTNTPANQFHYTKSFDKWSSWQIASYFEKEKIFDLDSLPSGLYGPVKIIYDK